MASVQQQARQQQKTEELCAAAIRALTGDTQLHYRGGRLHRGPRPLPVHAPHLRTSAGQDDGFAAWRGATDGMALRLRHSDPELHRQLAPAEPTERLIFELLEQLRCEALVGPDMPGMRDNLRRRFADWSRAFHRSGLTESSLGILLYTVSQICWSRLNGWPVLEDTEDLIEATRAAIAPLLGPALAGLRRHVREQPLFARHALALAAAVGEMLRSAAAQGPADNATEEEGSARAAFSLLLDFDQEEEEPVMVAATGHSKVLEASTGGYRVYTTRYDQQVQASSLVRQALLQEYRVRLDKRNASLGLNVARLARQLMAVLAVPQRDGWTFGEEHGYLDGRRLAQLVSSPAERRLFRLEQFKPRADCLVSFLVDCSGSMKQHSESVTVIIDVLVRALEQIGVNTEVLGFTTGAWNGGRARLDWLGRGKPGHPGRLNELCHMVVKEADRSWRRARTDIAALLKSDLYREGIDGEAVAWACERMLGRSEARRILIVISDGCPMDTATNLANDTYYLDNHLKQVVALHEQRRDVEILGLGVGLDLGPYYRRRLTIDLSRPIDAQLFFEVVQLIRGHPRH